MTQSQRDPSETAAPLTRTAAERPEHSKEKKDGAREKDCQPTERYGRAIAALIEDELGRVHGTQIQDPQHQPVRKPSR